MSSRARSSVDVFITKAQAYRKAIQVDPYKSRHGSPPLDRLLRVERAHAQCFEPPAGTVRLGKTVQDLLSEFMREAQGKGLSLIASVRREAEIVSDRELINVLLRNLIGNAIKYSNQGQIRIEAHRNKVVHEPGWTIDAKDQGPGIAPDRVQSLFDAFVRGDTHGKTGMGLGLAIAEQVARALRAKLQVQSELGKGSTFSVVFPAAITPG